MSYINGSHEVHINHIACPVNVQTFSKIYAEVQSFVETMPLKKLSMLLYKPTAGSIVQNAPVFSFTTQDQRAVHAYKAYDLIHDDPVLKMGIACLGAFEWEQTSALFRQSSAEAKVMDICAAVGMAKGWVTSLVMEDDVRILFSATQEEENQGRQNKVSIDQSSIVNMANAFCWSIHRLLVPHLPVYGS